MVSSILKASIIIPARDAMTTLPQTVDSVLNEACRKDVEIIIVNDGRERSTAKLTDRYPVKVIDGNGHGPAAARNIGVQISRGEILIFLDADCRVMLGWLTAHLQAHKRFGGFLAVGGAICMEPDAMFSVDLSKIMDPCRWISDLRAGSYGVHDRLLAEGRQDRTMAA